MSPTPTGSPRVPTRKATRSQTHGRTRKSAVLRDFEIMWPFPSTGWMPDSLPRELAELGLLDIDHDEYRIEPDGTRRYTGTFYCINAAGREALRA